MELNLIPGNYQSLFLKKFLSLFTHTLKFVSTLLSSNSYSRKSAFEFQLGSSQVIKGWDQGLLDMCIGEKRRLTIPPHLGYGDTGAGQSIPPKSTLLFEVECLEINQGPPPVNVFKEIDTNNDDLLSRDEVDNFISIFIFQSIFNFFPYICVLNR